VRQHPDAHAAVSCAHDTGSGGPRIDWIYGPELDRVGGFFWQAAELDTQLLEQTTFASNALRSTQLASARCASLHKTGDVRRRLGRLGKRYQAPRDNRAGGSAVADGRDDRYDARERRYGLIGRDVSMRRE